MTNNEVPLNDFTKNENKDTSQKEKKASNNKIKGNDVEKSEKMKFNDQSTNKKKLKFDNSKIKIIIKYNIFYEKYEDYRLFGDKFVENNKNNCKMLINKEVYDLCCFIDKNLVKNTKNKNNEIQVKLIEVSKILDMSYMFSKVSSLSKFSKWNTNEVEDMSHMFDGCLLKSLPDISSWDISNVIDISYMFNKCSELLSLPDISKWNTCNVMDINHIFSECVKLASLPDISKWNTSNIENMSYAFYYCANIINLPDISKWDMKKVLDINYMFANCKNLESIPDLSKWELTKIIYYDNLFEGCIKKEMKEFKKTFFKSKIFNRKENYNK